MRVVLCNCPPAEAERIARTLVESGLAACVNLSEIQSVYRWKGELCVEPESTLWIKVGADGLAALRTKLEEIHPYELPEIVVLPVDIAESFGPYVEWVRENSR